MTDELDLTARITEPSPPSERMYTVQNAVDQATIAILLAVADVARGPVSVDDLSRLAACCRSMVAPVETAQQPIVEARAILADVDEDIIAAYLGATGERLHGLDDDSRTTTIQELGMLASSAPKLRAELEAANAEVAKLRAELAEAKRIGEQPANVLAGVRSVLHAYGRADVLMTENAVRSVLRDLELARSQAAELNGTTQDVVNANKLISDVFALLAKDGFRSDNLLRLVETVLESLRQAQNERDATDAALDIANRNHGAQLSSTQHALRLANTQLEVANANLLAALRLLQDAPNAKMLVQGLVDLVAYWRRGGSPYDDAANAVEKILGATFADTLDQVRRERTETNEIGAIVAAATPTKGEHVHPRK